MWGLGLAGLDLGGYAGAMTVKVTLEYEDLPQELSALEQAHNFGRPAQEIGYEPVDPAAVQAPAELSPDQVAHQDKHPEDFQLHNAGKPAVETGGGQERTVPQEWDPDPEKH